MAPTLASNNTFITISTISTPSTRGRRTRRKTKQMFSGSLQRETGCGVGAVKRVSGVGWTRGFESVAATGAEVTTAAFQSTGSPVRRAQVHLVE